MYNEFIEILNNWKKFLSEIETKMQLLIKSILNEVKDNNKIYAIFFEYEWDLMNIKFIAKDVTGNNLVEKYDLLLDKINAKTLFPMDLFKRQCEIYEKYSKNTENTDFYDEYDLEKCDYFAEWFKLCWDKVAKEEKHIPKVFFSIHDTDFLWDLNKKEEVKYEEIIK